MSYNPYPKWTPIGAYVDGLDRQAERQKAIMQSSLETTEATISQGAPVIMPDSPGALNPTPTPARRPQPVEPFKLDLPFRFEAALSTAAKQEGFWSRVKRWLS